MSSLYWPYFVADYYRGIEIVAGVVAVIILLSSLDDLFIDLWYWRRKLVRALGPKRHYTPLTEAQIRDKAEQRLAIMVPAWKEHDVIALMLEAMVSTLDYSNYVIFVGTYQNDPATIAEVERMRRRYRHLVRVEVPHDGPTCKADCLNWIVQAILAESDDAFAGMILHDSEDVLHPLELKYFNYLLPRIDFIQLPVTSLERDWFELVAGTYMDEFAEWHTKDLVVRESLTGVVPSAGVGTCFSVRAMIELAGETGNQPFNTDTLTEDYDIGMRLSRRGMRQIFGKFPVDYEVHRRPWRRRSPAKPQTIRQPIGVREFFPDTFRTAYRQKARWTLGIGLQGWAQVGWQGSLANKYLLLRDRKGLVTSFIAILAYVLVAHFIVFYALDWLGIWTTYYPSAFRPDGWLGVVIVLNAIALLLRMGQRAWFVGIIYGPGHAALSIPRMVIGNFINAMAAARAWKQFLAWLFFERRLVWDKTMHDFPSSDQLVQQRQRLGELLVTWQVIDENQLAFALDRQRAEQRRLGEILIEQGWLDEHTLDEAVSWQTDLDKRTTGNGSTTNQSTEHR